MSYILDALKRAEAERNGSLAARPPLPSSFVAAAPARQWRRSLLVAGVLTLTAIAAVMVMALMNPRSTVVTAPPPEPVPQLAKAHSEPDGAPSAADGEAQLPAPAATAAPATPTVKRTPPPRAAQPKPRPAPEPELATLRELPEHIQREIPPLAVGGYLYSTNPADRTVLINKRLLHEGDEVVPGLRLESLRPNGMVLDYRGYRYRTTY